MVLNQFVNTGTDDELLKSLADEDSQIIDSSELNKALDKAKLVQKDVQVQGKNGKVYTRKQWMKASDVKSASSSSSSGNKGDNEPASKKTPNTSEGSKMSKDEAKSMTQSFTSKVGKTSQDRIDFMNKVESQNITWNKSDNEGINWMRCCMAMNKHFQNGGTFNIDSDNNVKQSSSDNQQSDKQQDNKQENKQEDSNVMSLYESVVERGYTGDKQELIDALKEGEEYRGFDGIVIKDSGGSSMLGKDGKIYKHNPFQGMYEYDKIMDSTLKGKNENSSSFTEESVQQCQNELEILAAKNGITANGGELHVSKNGTISCIDSTGRKVNLYTKYPPKQSKEYKGMKGMILGDSAEDKFFGSCGQNSKKWPTRIHCDDGIPYHPSSEGRKTPPINVVKYLKAYPQYIEGYVKKYPKCKQYLIDNGMYKEK